MKPLRLSVVLDQLHCRTISCEQLAVQCLGQERAYRDLNAFICLNPNVVQEARSLDRRLREGEFLPLHGIPIAVKDNIDTAGLVTSGGAAALASNVPSTDASVVARLKAAGAVVIGKTNLDELAAAGGTLSSLGGRTLNPFDPARTPAGSSGGSAVAVAIGACVLALGTETVNSIRNPAHVCGVAGLRATRGLVSRSGVIPLSPSMDVVGPLANDLDGLAMALAVMVGPDAADPVSSAAAGCDRDALSPERWPGVAGLRVGVLRGLFGAGEEHGAMNAVIEVSLRRLETAGATLVEIIDEEFQSGRLYDALAIHAYEFQEAFNGWLHQRGEAAPVRDLAAYVADGRWPRATMSALLETAMATPVAEECELYLSKRAAGERIARKMTTLLRDRHLDAFAYPVQQRPALGIGEKTRPERNGVLASALGWPALNVPVGFVAGERFPPLPVGLDLMGAPLSEPILFALGRTIAR
jgi:Asp-tRNA(Asn)/Glu-tRNA(Gln) amidotransferase A subunit family amidase